MENVPRYGASRSDHRRPDRESRADYDRPADVSLLKLANIISRDEALRALGRDTVSRYAFPAEEPLRPASYSETAEYDPSEYDLPEYDLPEFDADRPLADASQDWSPQGVASDPGNLDRDARGARQGQTVRAQHLTPNDDEATGRPQLGLALSELARLVGRIDSFLAAGSPRTGRFEQTTGGRLSARDAVDDDPVDDADAQDIEMPVPSRHDRLTNDTDDPGLSLYAPRRKRRAAFVVARTDPSESLYGGSKQATEERPSAARNHGRSYEPRQGHGDNHNRRPQQGRKPPKEALPRRHGRRFLTATAILAFTATAALYGYRTWTDAGSSHLGPIAAEAAPVAATGDSVDPPAVDASTNSGVSQSRRGVWSDLTDLLTPGATLDSTTSASRVVTGESAAAVSKAQPQRHDEDRARRSPAARAGAHVGDIVPIANAGVSTSTNSVLPCEVGATRASC